MSRRVIVCGSRSLAVPSSVIALLAEAHARSPIGVLVHGAATGVDAAADSWAQSEGVTSEPHVPDWNGQGKAAGPLRNKAMAALGASVCIAFPGGAGTASMRREAKAAGIPIVDVALVLDLRDKIAGIDRAFDLLVLSPMSLEARAAWKARQYEQRQAYAAELAGLERRMAGEP